MGWLQRLGIGLAPPPRERVEREPAPSWTERESAGIREFFRGISPDRSHAVLDLGSASETSLEVFEGLARWVRFGELVGRSGQVEGWKEVLDALPAAGERPYDLVLGWDILDRVRPEERPHLIRRLAEITAPEARLHLVVDASERAATRPLRFTLVGRDRMRLETVGPPRANWPPLLPAEVERILPPFRVVRAFTSKAGFREYVTVRGAG